MKTSSLHSYFRSIAKQAGVMPTYWSCEQNSLSNDRTPEISPGSEGAGYA